MSHSPESSLPMVNGRHHKSFAASERPHVLQITNHGIHDWDVIPGLPDTGGQNVFVNEMTHAMVELGYRVTIANRGGFEHPKSGKPRRGLDYRDSHRRLLYLEDSVPEFVRKEDMKERVPELADFLLRFLTGEGDWPALLVSHYWDAAAVGVDLNRRLNEARKHFWVPHSLGAVKKRNMDPSTWEDLRIGERIEKEERLLNEIHAVAATSTTIRTSLHDDYGCATDLFLPPCVDPERFYPRKIAADDDLWEFLAGESGLEADEIRRAKIITEVSRTDKTKRKDLLIEAFAEVRREVGDALLAMTVDPDAEPLAGELRSLTEKHGVADRVVLLGSIWDRLPSLYAVSHVYCTPSVMEGFGMAIQEAAASGLPAVASDLVPFAVEYLLGNEPRVLEGDADKPRVREGDGAIVVRANDVDGFVSGLTRLLQDDDRRRRMGAKARNITVPYFTWKNMTENFLTAAGFNPSEKEDKPS